MLDLKKKNPVVIHQNLRSVNNILGHVYFK